MLWSLFHETVNSALVAVLKSMAVELGINESQILVSNTVANTAEEAFQASPIINWCEWNKNVNCINHF